MFFAWAQDRLRPCEKKRPLLRSSRKGFNFFCRDLPEWDLAVIPQLFNSKPTAQGLCPIFVRVTLNHERIEFSIIESVHPDSWNSKAQRAKVQENDGQGINDSIQSAIDKLRSGKRQLEESLKPITARNIRNLYFDSDDTSIYLLEKFREHNERSANLVGIDISDGTLERYNTAYKHVQEFIKHKYATADRLFVDVNYQFIKDLEYYLKTERNCANNTTMKYIRNFHKIVKIGLANGWI